MIRDAIKMGIPSVIHEQNAYPGVTNKALSRHATRTMLAVADAQRHLDPKARCVLTGNPVRQEVIRARREDARKKLGLDERPLILSFGGSLGARKINEAVADLLAGRLAYDPDTVCSHHHEGDGAHQCGGHGEGEGHSCGHSHGAGGQGCAGHQG